MLCKAIESHVPLSRNRFNTDLVLNLKTSTPVGSFGDGQVASKELHIHVPVDEWSRTVARKRRSK